MPSSARSRSRSRNGEERGATREGRLGEERCVRSAENVSSLLTRRSSPSRPSPVARPSSPSRPSPVARCSRYTLVMPTPPSPLRRVLNALGPGVITGAADDDPSGIATYSITGAQFGTQFLWTAPVLWPLMAAVQMMCARIGLVTGRGLAGALRKKYPRWLLGTAAGALFIANTINVGADLGGMADAAHLLTGVPAVAWVLAFGIGIAIATVRLRYAVIANTLKWLALILVVYVVAAIDVHPNWATVLRATVVPQLPHGRDGDADAECEHPGDGRHAREQVGGVRHAAKVGADVDRVGDEQRAGRGAKQPSRILLAQCAGQAASGDQPDPRAHHLHRRHERPKHGRGPEELRAALRARDGIGRDSRRIVVGGARNDTRAKGREDSTQWGRLGDHGTERNERESEARTHDRGQPPVLPTR